MDNNAMLHIDDVTVAFPHAGPAGSKEKRMHTVLNHLHLDVEASEFVCVVGPSGCGKTTLLNCIAGFQPYSGTITLGGQTIHGPGPERGVMFQEYGLFPWFTVEENVAFGPKMQGMPAKERKERAQEYLQMVGLYEFRHHYPNRLSGGMKQRVSLARVLANRPQFLLMDEPFAALDEQTRQMLQTELLRVWEQNKITCMFITHSLSEAVYLADRVVVLMPNPGRVALDMRINLPRIRERNSEYMLAYQKLISDILKEGAKAS